MNKPKILFLDIETAPNIAYVWGLFDQNISHEHLEQSSYVLCWAAKWAGAKKGNYMSVQKWPAQQMLTGIHALLDEADIVVHFNGTKFDIPVLNKEFLKHEFKPPSPYKQVDMLRVMRGAFRFESNKMNSLLKDLGLGKKVEHRGHCLWVGCMKGDLACWKEMERYNRGDVVALEKLYKRVLPWIANHPNLGVYADRPACKNCGSINVQRRGREVAISKWYVRYQCQACGKWFRGEQDGRQTNNRTSTTKTT
jgi:predicted PolB exonuclease-like 3'-5' exonuclease